ARRDGLANCDLDLAAERHEDVDARAESNDAQAGTLLDVIANGAIGHDAPRDEAGDLAYQEPVASAGGLDADRRLLVLEARFLHRRVQEFPRIVVAIDDRSGDRVSVHVHVEHVHEYRDANRLPMDERRFIDLRDGLESSI